MAKRGVAKPTDKRPLTLEILAIKELLIWARRERIAVSQITVGSVVVAGIYDRKMDVDDGRNPSKDARVEVHQSIIEQYAGPLMNGATEPTEGDARDEIDPTEEDDDE